jgi:GAF domain-containing protein
VFNHDDRHLLRQIAQQVGAALEQQHLIVARLDTLTAELILLRQSETAMLQVLEELARAEEQEVNQMDYVTLTLTSP